jgi:hypothetical protein
MILKKSLFNIFLIKKHLITQYHELIGMFILGLLQEYEGSIFF